MAFRFEPFVAFRYLRSKRKEIFISVITVISVLGVTISVMVLDMVLGVMAGFENVLQEKLINANAHVLVRQFGGDIDEPDVLLEKISKVDGVLHAFPYTYNQAMLSTQAGSRGLLVRGVAASDKAKEKLLTVLEDKKIIDQLDQRQVITIERPDGTPDEVHMPPLVVGRALRDSLGVYPDSLVTLLAPKFSASPQGVSPRYRRFLVLGSYKSGLVEYESGLAYTSLEEAQKFFRIDSKVTGIEITVDDMFRSTEIAEKIMQALGGASSGYYATDWTEPNKALWEAMKLEKRVYFIVLQLLVLVASFSIVSTLVMVVMEKGRDIAIMKTLGASEGTILRIFLLHGAVIGIVGTLLGTLFGVLGSIGLREYGFPISAKVFGTDTVPVELIPENFVAVALAALVITILSGVYPAIRASRLRPAEALRYE